MGICVDPLSDREITESLQNIISAEKYKNFSISILDFPFHKYEWDIEFKKFNELLRGSF